MEVCCQPKIPLKSSKFREEFTTGKNKEEKFCSCCNRFIYDSLPCGEKSSIDPTRKISNTYDNESHTILESLSSKIEQKCKCNEQILCRLSNQNNDSKPINLNQDVISKKVIYLCGAPSNPSLER